MAERIDEGRVAPGRQPQYHPDVEALHRAGISPERSHELARHHGVDHPAATTTTGTIPEKNKHKGPKIDPEFSKVAKVDPQLYATDEKLKREVAALPKANPKSEQSQYVTNPQDPKDFAKDILIAAGLPDTADNISLLQRQMSEEGMPGSENNPLATTLPEKGSKSVNSVGVQSYPTADEGVVADAATLQGMGSLMAALKSGNATPQDYATALENSNYEGTGGASNPANVAYGQAYLGDTPEKSFGGGGGTGGGTVSSIPDESGQVAAGQQIANTSPSSLFQGLATLIPSISNMGGSQSLQQALSGLSTASNQGTLTANTTNAPGSPDAPNSQQQQTSVPNAAQYQQLLAAILPNIRPGAANG